MGLLFNTKRKKDKKDDCPTSFDPKDVKLQDRQEDLRLLKMSVEVKTQKRIVEKKQNKSQIKLDLGDSKLPQNPFRGI